MFVCVVCNKDFKSKGQMSNHEASKAHKKKLKVLHYTIVVYTIIVYYSMIIYADIIIYRLHLG